MIKNTMFMFVFAVALTMSVAKADDVVNTGKEIREILSPEYYSTAKSNAHSIDEWYCKEIRPELFDIWYGKKERIYLNGAWKLMKLENTRDKPNSDFGLKKGYDRRAFDDSEWFNQPVPYQWNTFFPNRRGVFINFGGIGWYRKGFTIPKKFKGKRVILVFRAIASESVVFVNGKRVGEHVNLGIDSVGSLVKQSEEGFEIDITNAVNVGKENSLAVRVYDDGLHSHSPEKPRYTGIGGIWQEVYLEARPMIYLKKALISPDVVAGTIKIKAFIVNNTGSETEITPVVKLSPWQSERYHLAKGKTDSVCLESFTLKPGKNEINATVLLKNPQYWSPENPYLYHFQLFDDKGELLGQERFGFRSFTCSERAFMLNGKAIYFRGQQCGWTSWSNTPGPSKVIAGLAYLNRGREIENWYETYLDLNLNLVRTHTTYYPHCFYEVADEKGALIYDEEYICKRHLNLICQKGELTPIFKEKIKAKVRSAYNYPSIIMRSLGNELYDQHFYANEIQGLKSWAPFLDKVYREYKRQDSTRPLTSSSGREASKSACKLLGKYAHSITEQVAVTDFNDCHNYQMTWKDIEFAEDDDWECSYKKDFDSYALDFGVNKPMINGETNISSLLPPWHGWRSKLDKEFLPHIKNGKLDRKWFAENWQVITAEFGSNWGAMSLVRAIPKFGFLNTVVKEKSAMAQADFYRRLIEQHRRKRKYVVGLVSNQPMTFYAGTSNELYEPVGSYVRKACQPILACVSGKFNRNLISGVDNGKTSIYVMNDTEKTIYNIEVKLMLKGNDTDDSGVLPSLKLDHLIPGQMKVLSYEIVPSETLPSGHYMFSLDVFVDNKLRSSNDYKLFLLNGKDVTLEKKEFNAKIAIYCSEKEKKLFEVLTSLNVSYVKIDDFKTLKDYDLLILGPYSYSEGQEAGGEITDWVAGGGKLLCFEQRMLPESLPLSVMSVSRDFGYFTELILPEHPLFKGLCQSDFKYWNGDVKTIRNKWLFRYCVLPLHEGVLACQESIGCRIGMDAGEFKFGKGLMILSQLEAVKRFREDSVATKYLINMFNYAFDGWNGKYAAVLGESSKETSVAISLPDDKAVFINLRNYVNMGFADDKKGDRKGGWTDQGSKYDFYRFPTGKQRFLGVPFDIIKPEKNKGKSCIVLQGQGAKSGTDFLPLKVEKIKIGKKVKKLYFLVSAAWVHGANDIGGLQILYNADGTAIFDAQELKLVNGENIADWWNPRVHKLTGAKLAWCGLAGRDDAGNVEIGCFMIEWNNPAPNRVIEFINFYSTGNAVPILIGITGEKL